MAIVTRSLRAAWVGSLVASLALPAAPAFTAGGSLGTARGVRAAALSLDGGRRWLPLTGRSLPVVDTSRIRTTGGGVMLDLVDGSRVNVLPYSTVSVRETVAGTTLALQSGRLAFHLPAGTRVAIDTPAASLAPVRTGDMAGEVFADGSTGIKMTAGRLQVHPAGSAEPVMAAGLAPVFVPSRPAVAGALFTADVDEQAAPAGSRGIFNVKGESLGYLQPDGQLVVAPGFTSDLAGPFAPRTVQTALATVPGPHDGAAEPLFDVNGQSVGYVAGPAFYAQAQGAPAAPAPLAGAAIAGTAGLDLAVGAGNTGRGRDCRPAGLPPGPPATPGSPCRRN